MSNRATGDPPEIETAAPIDEIGSGGKNEMEKQGRVSEVDFSNIDPGIATVGRIIATHYGFGGDL